MRHTSLPPTLADRHDKLHGIPAQLRQAHFGIDTEIQGLLDAFAPWYRFAETQTHPRTIGLWGMTGTGKSSLVRALVRAAGLEERTYWLDAGECQDENWLDKVFEQMDEHLNGSPFILVVDEFQHARTLKKGEELTEPATLRRFWELLDSGRMVTWSRFSRYDVMHLVDFQAKLKSALQAGVRIEHGHVVEGSAAFKRIMSEEHTLSDNVLWAVPSDVRRTLRDLHTSPLPSLTQIEQKLATLSAAGILSWIDDLLKNTRSNRVVDASKMLVVLLGNLDELYSTSKEPLAELDPDVLLRRHQNIGLAGVQHALLKLFRIEQVGRIGRSHVIFPPIGSGAMEAMITHGTAELAARLTAHCGSPVEVDRSLTEHLRGISTIAVLGARPVVQAIQSIVPLLLSQVVDQHAGALDVPVRLAVSSGDPIARLLHPQGPQELALLWPSAMREAATPTKSFMERTAIHEVGHLLCGVLLCGKIPLQVCARTRDPQIGGFVAWSNKPEEHLLRSAVVPELACFLGGWAAELLHYGELHTSAGSTSDLEQASSFALYCAKRSGFGTDRSAHAEHSNAPDIGFRTRLPQVEAQAQEWLVAAEALALETLRAQQPLFHSCVELLIAKGSLGAQELAGILSTNSGYIPPA